MTTPPPPVAFKPFALGPEPLTLIPGVDGLALLLPATEPISAGPLPVVPALCDRVSVNYGARVVGVRSGQTCTSATATARRPRYRVRWDGISKAERDSLQTFLADHDAGAGDGVFAFDLEPDGPDTGVVVVRAIGAIGPADTLAARNNTVDGGGGVYTPELLCEEVF